ncbi:MULTISPECIES: TetR/AcrR family transcriptional regulator [Mesorhizobium]|uniref:TetR/AcrR family transcriptional regulator n=1 Tax=Mesorhizobium denitrificans TaxID=2294114 RepID=A0A371XEA0_9HYPH|nr:MULTISPECIES: TetR/AcrR family transcriptional regulator [Mesorhizobium]RFC67560.1 TetR/AcrR family transcriptional regulator [Mesorhizobium denitrificans]
MALDKDEVSSRVLDIAEDLLNEGGAINLKARTIAEKAGIAVGSIYNLYGDLDGLHLAVNFRLLDRLSRAGMETMTQMQSSRVLDTKGRLLALARTYLEYVAAHPHSWAALLAFSPARIDAARREDYIGRLDGLFGIITKVLMDDKKLALDEEECVLNARILWSSVHGIVTSGVSSRASGNPEVETWRQVDHLVTVYLAGLERHPGRLTH